MAIAPIQNEYIPVNTSGIIPTSLREGSRANIVQEVGDLPGKDSFSQNLSRWSELQKINDSSNEVAQKQRTSDKILKGVEDYVDHMKAQLERIIKNFPPFPPESAERIRLLRSYAGFRRLIDQLTIPPPEESRVGAETSKVLPPADSVPSANQPGEMTPGTLEA